MAMDHNQKAGELSYLDGPAVGVRFLFQATSGRTGGSGLRMHKGRLDVRGCFFREGVTRHGKRLCMVLVKSSSLEVFKMQWMWHLGIWVSGGLGSDGESIAGRLFLFRGLFQSQQICSSIILLLWYNQ